MHHATEQFISAAAEEALRWRRHIHAHPDLSFNEQPTADHIHRPRAGAIFRSRDKPPAGK